MPSGPFECVNENNNYKDFSSSVPFTASTGRWRVSDLLLGFRSYEEGGRESFTSEPGDETRSPVLSVSRDDTSSSRGVPQCLSHCSLMGCVTKSSTSYNTLLSSRLFPLTSLPPSTVKFITPVRGPLGSTDPSRTVRFLRRLSFWKPFLPVSLGLVELPSN